MVMLWESQLQLIILISHFRWDIHEFVGQFYETEVFQCASSQLVVTKEGDQIKCHRDQIQKRIDSEEIPGSQMIHVEAILFGLD